MKKPLFISNAKKMTIACGILAASLSFGASAFAFSDLKGDPAEAKINSLHKDGIINGVNKDKFAPKSKVSFAQGIQFIVGGLNLKPVAGSSSSKASDYFDKVSDKAWYASAFVIAKQNGLSLDRTIDPNGTISRAQFAHLLTQALQSKGNFPVTLMYVDISDGDKLSNEVMNSLQILLNTHIATLDKNGKFRPNDAITRSEAAALTYDAAAFAKRVIVSNGSPTTPTYETEVTLTKAGEGVNKATLTVNNLPHPGYGLVIERIEFGKDKTAVIYFNVTAPDPGKMYAQVISKASVVTYLPEGYKAVAKSVSGSTSYSSSATQ
ncbi:S-layer homology domain-containing protein [Paenibacillus sp. FSL R10-2734]|uniref:S-layer homology domain-containing protein n=1 Tax=Paenibacillus sp. FSL R10-2734 TaxID=2954691 RepID=UPI0030D8D452